MLYRRESDVGRAQSIESEEPIHRTYIKRKEEEEGKKGRNVISCASLFFFSSLFSSAPFYIISSSHVCLSVCLSAASFFFFFFSTLFVNAPAERERRRAGTCTSSDISITAAAVPAYTIYYCSLHVPIQTPPRTHSAHPPSTISFFYFIFLLFSFLQWKGRSYD
jgi:hypothetical protein